MDEKAWFEALDLTPDAEDAGPETEEIETVPDGSAAETAAEVGDEGENEREPADPAAEEDAEEEPEPPAQDPEERRRQAAARRQREREAEIQAAVQEALRQERERTDAELRDALAWAGLRDGDKPIESVEALRDYRLRAELRSGSLTPETLRSLVQQEMRQTAAPEAPADPAQDAVFQQQVEAELAEIRKYDPNVQTVEDLLALDRAELFQKEVAEHNHSFLEAYRITYADRIAQERADQAARAAAQKARNSARSKDHLRPDGARGAGDVAVPPDTMRYYRSLMPDMSDDDIRRDYNHYAKNVK